MAFTGHGAMARLDRAVRTLREYMHDAFFGLRRKSQKRITRYVLFSYGNGAIQQVPHSFHLRVRNQCSLYYKRGWKNTLGKAEMGITDFNKRYKYTAYLTRGKAGGCSLWCLGGRSSLYRRKSCLMMTITDTHSHT